MLTEQEKPETEDAAQNGPAKQCNCMRGDAGHNRECCRTLLSAPGSPQTTEERKGY